MKTSPLIPFKWYDKYHKQARFDNDCSSMCQFELITDRTHLLPFQFMRDKSPYLISDFILRPFCNHEYKKIIPENDSNFVTSSGYWVRNDWSISNGYAYPDADLPGNIGKNGILTIGKKYTIHFCIKDYSSTNNLGINVNAGGVNLGNFNAIGFYEYTFTATNSNLLITTLAGAPGEILYLDEVQIDEEFTVVGTDIIIDTSLIQLLNAGDVDYIVYGGQTLDKVIPCGKYYAIINSGGVQYFSEVFDVRNFLPAKSPYIKLSWKNSCDLGDVIYNETTLNPIVFENYIWIDSVISKPEYPFKEEGEDDGNQEFHPTFQKWNKSIQLMVPKAPEFMVDALTSLRLHDDISITLALNEEQVSVDTPTKIVSLEYDVNAVLTDCFSNVVLKMKLDQQVVDETCCEAIVVDECLQCLGTIPETNVLDIPSGYALLFGYIGYDDGLYKYILGNWVLQVPEEGTAICQTDNNPGGRKWYFDGTNWFFMPLLQTINYTGVLTTLKGKAIPGSFVIAQKSPNGIVWTDGPNIVSAEDFFTTGVDYPGLLPIAPILTYFRVRCFTLKCDYGYSNTIIHNEVPPE